MGILQVASYIYKRYMDDFGVRIDEMKLQIWVKLRIKEEGVAYDTPSSLFVYSLIYLKPQSFLMTSASTFSTSFSISSGRLQKKSVPVLSSSVLMFTT